MRSRAASGLGLLLLLSACGGAGGSSPPDILLGADACDYCRMVISEERHAAAARVESKEARFDDPGCLRAWLSEREPGPAHLWVHDETGAWLPVLDAWFVRAPDLFTPMGSGILAFSASAEAEAVASDLGVEVLRWQDL